MKGLYALTFTPTGFAVAGVFGTFLGGVRHAMTPPPKRWMCSPSYDSDDSFEYQVRDDEWIM